MRFSKFAKKSAGKWLGCMGGGREVAYCVSILDMCIQVAGLRASLLLFHL